MSVREKGRKIFSFRRSRSLPTRRGVSPYREGEEQWISSPPVQQVQYDTDEIHGVLRDVKRDASDIKAKFKKNEKKKQFEEVKDTAKRLKTQILKLIQLLHINDDESNLHNLSWEDDRRIGQPQRDLREGKDQIQNLRSKCQRMENQISQLTKEKEEALRRLSQIAGSKLRENNPAIADLSDPNRPLKLAEKVNELYDNEWTDLAEDLENLDKNVRYIPLLLDIFTHSYDLSYELATKQMAAICQLVTSGHAPGRHRGMVNMQSIPSEVRHKCIEFRKSIAETTIASFSIQNEVWHYVEQKEGSQVASLCTDYIGKCVKFSWYMCIQDPPVHLEYRYLQGNAFDSKIMRTYTKSGPYIDFLVWPALFLCKNGNLLSKAIVQGMSTSEKETNNFAGSSGVYHGGNRMPQATNVHNPYQNYDMVAQGSYAPTSEGHRDRGYTDTRRQAIPHASHYRQKQHNTSAYVTRNPREQDRNQGNMGRSQTHMQFTYRPTQPRSETDL